MQSIFTKFYPIYFGQNAFESLNLLIREKDYSQIFILVDFNTKTHCLDVFLNQFNWDLPFTLIEIPSQEIHKNLNSLSTIWQKLSNRNADRNSMLINLGGGMVTDIGGFAASTFLRGIDFVHVSTSLLGMVDASVGGKTAINFLRAKNQIGTFSYPKMVLIDPNFLSTLPKREILSGFAEMLKHGLIWSQSHWRQLKQFDDQNFTNLESLIFDSVSIKNEVVESDPKESGQRKILNFGHTIGHAIESEWLETSKPLLHGEAIGLGMCVEAILSRNLGFLDSSSCREILLHLVMVYNLFEIPKNKISQLMQWMSFDKKNKNQEKRFALINAIGSCQYNLVASDGQIIEAIENYNDFVRI